MRTTPQSDGSGGGGGDYASVSGGGGRGGGSVIGLEAILQSDRRRELWKSWEPRLSLTEEGSCGKFGSNTSV